MESELHAMNPLQSRIETVGREIFARMQGETPRVFSRRNLTGRLLDWSMQNDALKTNLFRFVDVLPSLTTARDIAKHAVDYLGDGDTELPWAARLAVNLAPKVPWLTALAARQGVTRIAHTFILASNPAQAITRLRRLRQTPLAFTADILGETVVSESEADRYLARYVELIETLAREAAGWPEVKQIDLDDRGTLPKVNVSVKISALSSQISPADFEGSIHRLSERLRPLLRVAKRCGVFINFDMEHTALKDLTIELWKRLLDEEEFRDFPHAGIALQAYLRESERDLAELIGWAKNRQRRITIRLIKGAYWDYETILARQRNWPVPVFEHKRETDANYERLASIMLDHRDWISCAFGTHSIRSIASCIVGAELRGQSKSSVEVQMLYGMAEPIKLALVKMGYRVREYCPIGEVLSGMSYLVRRLLENTSNEGFLRATFEDHIPLEQLLRDPAEPADDGKTTSPAASGASASPLGVQVSDTSRTAPAELAGKTEAGFVNEPHTDFAKRQNREQMAAALAAVKSELGRFYPLRIGGAVVRTEREIVSTNPARPSEVIGRMACADLSEADLAVREARKAFASWGRTPIETRARLLERAAEILRAERYRFAALEVFETGKSWSESDADVAEAIDFLNFYAHEMRRLDSKQAGVPGETTTHQFIPRGLAVVIAPWNFPLAILCGMTSAAIVAGNCALVKPSEQSVVTGAWFVDLLSRAGLPPGVVNFVPGPGASVGAHLVAHPEVQLIVFTGSREVGLKIYETAGQTRPGQLHLKKVICEMGGKNAVIVDSDADLDEAIPGIVQSAFGYQGQKCSAASRLIVLKENYGRVLERLIEATRSLRAGYPEDPATVLGPVIDKSAYQRILEFIEVGKREAELAFQAERFEGDGYFIPPTIFKDVPPNARIAQEEIFGPVLSIMVAANLNEALAVANGTVYGLTGGLYSRNPANIERVKSEFQVGNLYINRPITGALVGRHPFGGFKMSGGGTKAGGLEYLQNFLYPRTVTENQMRRGFAPHRVYGSEHPNL